MTTLDYVMRKKGDEPPDPISVRLDADQVADVERLAVGERISRNAMFRKLVDEGLLAHSAGRAPPALPRIADPLPPPAMIEGLLDVVQRLSGMVERYGSPPKKKTPRVGSREEGGRRV